MTCRPDCTFHRDNPTQAPAEPPVGTWVKDRFGSVHVRREAGWAPSPQGYPGARWEPMWEARGPLTECTPWGV